jgi:hypothetical protein
LGAPTAAARAAIESIADTHRLEDLLERAFSVSSWDDLLKSN